MTSSIERWMERLTIFDCDLHGNVSARFGEATSEGMCKNYKYYINYCCGLRCTNEKPESIMEQYLKEQEKKK